MTRPIQTAEAKGIEKMPDAIIDETEEQRNIQLEFLRKQQLQRLKNAIEE